MHRPLNDGANPYANIYDQVFQKGWARDYLTSALPYAQKGFAVDIPLGDVTLKDWDGTSSINDNTGRWRKWDDHTNMPLGTASAVNIAGQGIPAINSIPSAYDPNGTLEVQATTINDLRRAIKLQEWLEKNARAGTRYTESIMAHFGVKSSDGRLQGAEYITGLRTPIIVSEVLNTTGTEDLPQGNMSGHVS